jgi:hypothetical protein
MTVSTKNIAKLDNSGHKKRIAAEQRPVSFKSRFAAWFFAPVLAPIMQQRIFMIVLAGFAFVQIGLTAAGWPGWQCPIYSLSGISCPGCGLSRAMTLFIQGHWHAAFHMHAFAPILLIVAAFFAITAAMPLRLRQTTLLRVADAERSTGIMIIMVAGIIMYWGLRIAGVINSTIP